MDRLRAHEVTVGDRFDRYVFLSSGERLIGPEEVVRPIHILKLGTEESGSLILADDLGDLETAGMLHQVSSQSLKIGNILKRSLLTKFGHVIVEGPIELVAHHLAAISLAEVIYEKPNTDKGGRGRSGAAASDQMQQEADSYCRLLFDELKKELAGQQFNFRLGRDEDRVIDYGSEPIPDVEEIADRRREHQAQVAESYAKLHVGQRIDVLRFDQMIDRLLAAYAENPLCFGQYGVGQDEGSEYLASHAYSVMVLGISCAKWMGWSDEDVRLVALGGLLSDVGMVNVPKGVRMDSRPLSDLNRMRVMRHPIDAAQMLENIDGLPAAVRLIALEHHERENGSGYPMAREGETLTDHARLLSVVDSYVAMVSDRAHRKAMLPYHAMEDLIRSTVKKEYWVEAMRALLGGVSLFPVGSYVRLRNHRRARVVRSGEKRYDRPKVMLLDESGRSSGEVVDLAEQEDQEWQVKHPMPAPRVKTDEVLVSDKGFHGDDKEESGGDALERSGEQVGEDLS
ncbi:HD-GYP domain-containing protein [Poriferisphaera sp. WC338]|uniref:HD-GYP domain-containing protein n=1 Tax=Poriferisphaera sp. WC338 TaxID=3425129 RepID=UPI003D81A8E6